MRKNERGFTLIEILIPLAVLLVLSVNIALFWVVGSAITSSMKSVNSDCDKTYPVEAVFNGDWFCPEMNHE